MSRRPVIGLCAARERGSWGVWVETCDQLPRSYSRAVQRAGAIALLLPADDAVAEHPAQLLDMLDGLVLSGGTDIDPASYGARPHPRTGETWPERDRFEIGLAHAALERDLPLLGICRGMQMLNVARGGTLEQHLPDTTGTETHAHTPGAFGDHDVTLVPGSLAARCAGGTVHPVKSHHHQGVAELGEGLVVSGRSSPDGVIEAIELPDRRFALGVLWHPEEEEESALIAAFLEQGVAA